MKGLLLTGLENDKKKASQSIVALIKGPLANWLKKMTKKKPASKRPNERTLADWLKNVKKKPASR